MINNIKVFNVVILKLNDIFIFLVLSYIYLCFMFVFENFFINISIVSIKERKMKKILSMLFFFLIFFLNIISNKNEMSGKSGMSYV